MKKKSFFRLLPGLILLLGMEAARAQAPVITIHSDLPLEIGARQVVHGHGVFVANYFSIFYSSTDGVHWQQFSSPAIRGSNYNPPTFAFGAGKFVCVGDSGSIATSTDGINWTALSSGTTNYLTDVKFLHGDFFAVGNNASLLHSGNGTRWRVLNIGKGNPADQYTSIEYGNGYFVINAINNQNYPVIYRSGADTLGNWTADTLTSPTKVIFLKNYFYRIDKQIQSSTDAASWTPIAFFSQSSRKVAGGFYDSNNVYLVGPSTGPGTPTGLIYPSTDGLNFNSFLYATVQLTGGLYARHHDYVFGQGGIERSADGINYELLGGNFQSLAFHDSTYVRVGAVKKQGFIERSPNFLTWKDHTPDSTTALAAVVYDGRRYLAVGYGPYVAGGANPGSVYTSPHGVNWTKLSSSSPSLFALAYGAGRYVAAGLDNTPVLGGQLAIYSSTDGVSWNSVYAGDSLLQRNVTRVKYMNGRFFATGSDYSNEVGPLLLTSADGVTWHTISPHLPFNVDAVDDLVYDGSKYTLMGTEDDNSYFPIGFFSASTTDIDNPDSWGNKGGITSPPAGTLLASGVGPQTFAYSHGHFVGGVCDENNGDNGYLLYSGDGIHWDNIPLGATTGIAGIDTLGVMFRMLGYGNTWLTVSFPGDNVTPSADTALKLAVIPEKREDSRFRVYPNPAGGSVTVSLPETGAGLAVLYSATGEEVKRKEFNDYSLTLSLQGLPAGVYHLSVRQNGKQYQREILHR